MLLKNPSFHAVKEFGSRAAFLGFWVNVWSEVFLAHCLFWGWDGKAVCTRAI